MPRGHLAAPRRRNTGLSRAYYTGAAAIGASSLVPGIVATLGAGSKGTPNLRGTRRGTSVTTVTTKTAGGYTNRKKIYVTNGKKKKGLKSQVKDIKKSLKSDQATFTQRERFTADAFCSLGYSSTTSFAGTGVSDLESALANLQYFDPSNPATLITASGATGAYSRQYHFKSTYKKLTVRNNYQIPCQVKVYSYVPKTDTDQSPTQFFAAGVLDQYQSPAQSTTNVLAHISDIDIVNDNWKSLKTWTRVLDAGKQMTCTWSAGPFNYDPSNVDTHNLAYQTKYKSHIWVVRLEGVLGHDASADNQATLGAEVDLMCDVKHVITYDAGVSINKIRLDNNAPTAFTGSGVVTNKPMADNQAQSTA